MTLEGRSKMNESFKHSEFSFGLKTISVDINLKVYSASIRFGSRKGLFIKKILGETTNLFLITDKYIQHVAKSVDHLIVLHFDTADSNLKLWARSKASQLGFDSIEPEDENSYRVTVEKTYFPG